MAAASQDSDGSTETDGDFIYDENNDILDDDDDEYDGAEWETASGDDSLHEDMWVDSYLEETAHLDLALASLAQQEMAYLARTSLNPNKQTRPNDEQGQCSQQCCKDDDDDDEGKNKAESDRTRPALRRPSVYDMIKQREQGILDSDSLLSLSQSIMPNRSTQVLERHGSRAYSGQFSDDGNFFFSCTQDFRLHMYNTTDPANIEKTGTIQGERGQWTITDCSLSPDNSKMIYSSITPIVHLASVDPDRDTETHHTALDFDPMDDGFGIWSVRFSGDAKEIVAGASNECLYVFDIETRSVLHEIAGHDDHVNAVCFADQRSPHILFSASDDSFVKIWDRRSLGRGSKPAGIFVGHTEGVTYLDSKSDGRYALSNGKDQTMKMWDLRKCLEENQFRDDETLQVGYYSERWDYRSDNYPGPRNFRHPRDCSVQTFTGHSVLKTLIRCHFSPLFNTGQQYVYTGSADGIVRIFSLDGQLVHELNTNDGLKGNELPRERMAFDFFLPRRSWAGQVTRDVSWHPFLPYMISTSWCGAGGGASLVHDYHNDGGGGKDG
ncbi:hypothetical protein HDU86_001045 [Geranomyces michiganensis]|nr:hypothetical protein HDU86_001045 [Geranomyces michiganensis]